MNDKWKSGLSLFFASMAAMGGVIVALDALPELWETPKGVGGSMMAVSGVALAWLSKGWQAFLNKEQ